MPELEGPKNRLHVLKLRFSRPVLIAVGVFAALAVVAAWQFWSLSSNLKSSTKIMQGLRDELEALRKEKEETTSRAESEKQRAESLNTELSSLRQDKDATAQKQGELEAKVRQAEAALDTQNKKVQELEKRLREADQRIRRQRQTNASIEEKRTSPGMSSEYVKLVENEWLAATAKTEELKKDLDRTLNELAGQNKERSKLRYETATMHYNLAVILTEKGDYRAAIREYEKVIESRPEDADAHYNLGILYDDHMLDNVKALEHYREYIRLAPASAEAPRVREWIHKKEFDETFETKGLRRKP